MTPTFDSVNGINPRQLRDEPAPLAGKIIRETPACATCALGLKSAESFMGWECTGYLVSACGPRFAKPAHWRRRSEGLQP